MSRILVVLLALAAASGAHAHGPATWIGRTAEALSQVPVSYTAGSAVTDVEAANFNQIVAGLPVAVAFLPAAAATEIGNDDPDAVAEEIAREAELDGTLVVLVGDRLGAWSDELVQARLDELAVRAETLGRGSPVAATEAFVRSVAAEATDGGVRWTLVGIALVAAAGAALVVFSRSARRRG